MYVCCTFESVGLLSVSLDKKKDRVNKGGPEIKSQVKKMQFRKKLKLELQTRITWLHVKCERREMEWF